MCRLRIIALVRRRSLSYMMKALLHHFLIYPVLASLICLPEAASAQAATESLEALRAWAMRDVFVLKDYRPGKNSFVESPKRHVGAWTGPGFRRTLLDVKGQGAIRHLWTTRGEGAPYFDWEFYVDGETTPSIRGTDVELVEAAARFQSPFAGFIAPPVPVSKRDYNLFLPIPFDRSIRVEVVQREPTFRLWFCQLDYRLEDDSLAGARLLSRREGTNLVFETRHWPKPAAAPPREVKTLALQQTKLQPGQSCALSWMNGP
ncbi:MAG: DUF2961 domain-containing protein, partial [Planctomycetes bacterium]|nr:DUF2961 domain-containing protein [Planctomycetota bacterium]